MKDFIKNLLGSSPRTTVIGWIIAGLTAAYALSESGETDWKKLAFAFLIAVYSRVSKDSNGINRKDAPIIKQVIEEKKDTTVL